MMVCPSAKTWHFYFTPNNLKLPVPNAVRFNQCAAVPLSSSAIILHRRTRKPIEIYVVRPETVMVLTFSPASSCPANSSRSDLASAGPPSGFGFVHGFGVGLSNRSFSCQ